MRGELTQKIDEISLKYINKKMSNQELRLIPYLHHILINFNVIDYNKINRKEMTILDEWVKNGYIKYIDNPKDKNRENKIILMSKDFWNFMNEVLYLAYVNKK